MELVGISGSPQAASKSRSLCDAAVRLHGAGQVIDLGALDAEALLGRRDDASLHAALDAVGAADVLVVATPVYRATYTGLLKVFFDQLREGSLRDTAVIGCATGATPAHFLALDTGMRSLVASVGGWMVPTVVYATAEGFDTSGRPGPALIEHLERALSEAGRLAVPSPTVGTSSAP